MTFSLTRTVYDYTEALCRLLPKGILYRLEKFFLSYIVQDSIVSDTTYYDSIESDDTFYDSILSGDSEGDLFKRLLSCFASRLVELEGIAISYLNDTDPINCSGDHLTDFLRVLGIPDECMSQLELTESDLQKIAHVKFLFGSQTTNKQFYLDVAESLGYDITVEENIVDLNARIMGIARMNVERMGGRSGNSRFQITINSGVLDNEILKCILEKATQAHAVIYWIEV
jgi:uncharacterized protein YmfQ (DUF2313 family)